MTRLTQEQYDNVYDIVDIIKITKDKYGHYDAQYYPETDRDKNILTKNIPGCWGSRCIEHSIDPDEMIGVSISERHYVVSDNGDSYLPSYMIMMVPLYNIESSYIRTKIDECVEDTDYNDPLIVYTRFVMVDGILMPLCDVTF